MTTMEWITAAGVVVQVLLLAGLIWYCFETRGIRITSQAQLEALHTPCITFRATPREGAAAVLDMNEAQGAMILDFDGGDAVLYNIGTGPAVNISYVLTLLGVERPRRIEGYVSFIPNGVRCTVPISRNNMVGRHYDCLLQYESLSQTCYATRLAIQNLVLTPPFRFDKVGKNG